MKPARIGSLLSLLLTGMLTFTVNLSAQSDSILDEGSRATFRAVTNALVALASDDDLSAGTYRFKNESSSDMDLELYKWVIELPIGDSAQRFVPLLEFTPSILNLKQDESNQEIQASSDIDSWSIGAGAGIRMKFFDEFLEVTPRFKIEYSEVEYDFSVAGVDDSFINSIIPDTNTWSYIPSLEGKLHKELGEDKGSITIESRLSYVYVDTSTSNSNIDSFSDQSWIWKSSIAYSHDLDLGRAIGIATLRPRVGRVDMHGAARDGFEFNNFYEFGFDLLTTKLLPSYFEELGLGATYIYEDEVQGWRFGFLAKLA